MSRILVVEDDDAIRNNIARLLKLEGHEVLAAGDGAQGLARAREVRPEIVITDVGMPGLDGFQLLEALRADTVLSPTPVMLLTALDDRASMRRGMTAGADDYLAKPFTREELLDAIAGLLEKRRRMQRTVDRAVQSREAELQQAFADALGGQPVAERIGLDAPAGAIAEARIPAAVLFAQVRHFTGLTAPFSVAEVSEWLSAWFRQACEPVLRHGGRHVRFVGEALVAVFTDEAAPADPAARRALAAALDVALAAHAFRGWLERRFSDRVAMPFAVGVGLDVGELTLLRTGEGPGAESIAVGQALHQAARLECGSGELGWTVAASSALLQAAGAGVRTRAVTALPAGQGGAYIEVAEVTGLAGADEAALADPACRTGDLAAALHANAEVTARAVKGALQSRLAALKGHAFAPGQEPPRLRGYRLLRKIGSGGMTEVYLAERDSDGLPLVLKVLDAGRRAGEYLARFIQEYALLSRIDHPNVVRIHDQGFTDDHAFIAMEYFPLGDLRSELRAGMARPRAIQVVLQVARALSAIHARGVIHRDLKPENIMRREDGSVALADFGIAKSLAVADLAFTQTRHGDVVGTPYYLSPEQAAGQAITPRSDLYSLGVLLHELLTGQRPFRADSLDELLGLHLRAPTPRLPAQHEALQPVLDRLMAKRPEDRFSDAGAVAAELQRLGFAATVASRADRRAAGARARP